MAADRDPPGLIDYVVTAISPALVMLMVGSLVFFLVEVLYAGQHEGPLLYTMFFFVAGSVLVARIAIQVDRGRAGVYGAFLALATFAAISAYVDYPKGSPLGRASWLANLGLLALIYWSANKLTWDCTHLDETQDVSGRGLLSAAGLSRETGDSGEETADRNQESADLASGGRQPPEPERKRGGKKKKKDKPPSWLWRWHSYRQEQRKKPHTPGVWVIYFALAALPLFAVGQSLIDPDDADRRRATFYQMVVYIASALGLLATTSLLGLRRYLRQRKAVMPGSLTAGWLGLAAGVTVVFLVVGAALPRPHSETPLVDLARAGKSEREASEYAQLDEGAGKGEGKEGEETEKGPNGQASGKGGESGGSKGEKGSGGQGQKGSGGGGKDGKGGAGKDKGGKSGSESKGGQKGKSDGQQSKDEQKEGGRGGDTDRGAKEARNKDSQGKSGRPRSQPAAGGALEKVAGIVKWVVVAIVVVLVVVGIALAVLKYLAPFTDWAQRLLDAIRNWWANLFGRKARTGGQAAEAAEAGPVRPPPFSAFSDPFADGTAGGREVAELVAYTFAALDSWAWDRGHGRRAAETPLEFAARLGGEFPDLAADLRRFAGQYARVAYSDGPPPGDTRRMLEEVWDQLVHGVAVPVS